MSATNRGSAREAQDRYMTPVSAISVLGSFLDLRSKASFSFLEPCYGTGNIFNHMPSWWNKHWCELDHELDYFSKHFSGVDLIVTNPPFSKAEQFLEKSLTEAKVVVYLLRLNFLGSKKRKEFFYRVGLPSHLFVLSQRPSFTGKGTDATEYAWFVWDQTPEASDKTVLTRAPGIYIA